MIKITTTVAVSERGTLAWASEKVLHGRFRFLKCIAVVMSLQVASGLGLKSPGGTTFSTSMFHPFEFVVQAHWQLAKSLCQVPQLVNRKFLADSLHEGQRGRQQLLANRRNSATQPKCHTKGEKCTPLLDRSSSAATHAIQVQTSHKPQSTAADFP